MKILRSTLLAVAVLAVCALPAHAQTVSPVPAPTIITTAPYTITKAGYYQLGKDLIYQGNSSVANDAIITINSGNVILDFAGHFISGPSTNTATALVGIYANEKGNLIIRNGTIAYCYQGIWLNGNGQTNSLNVNQRIDNMLVTYCYTYGVLLTAANYCKITNNQVTFIGGSTYDPIGAGMFFNGGVGNNATDNIITNVTANGNNSNSYGIFNSGGLSLYGNKVSNVVANSTSVNGTATGIYNGLNNTNTCYFYNNTVISVHSGIDGGVKRNNTVINCTVPYEGDDATGNVHFP